eukprot:306752-Amphidinium_carterae.1
MHRFAIQIRAARRDERPLKKPCSKTCQNFSASESFRCKPMSGDWFVDSHELIAVPNNQMIWI